MAPVKIAGAAAPGLAAPESAHYVLLDVASLGTTTALPDVAASIVRTPGGNPANADHIEDNVCIIGQGTAERKTFLQLRAEAAMVGVGLERSRAKPGTAYFVRRGGHCVDCRDLTAAKVALQRLGARL